MISPTVVVLLLALIYVNKSVIPIAYEFVDEESCRKAKTSVEAKYRGAKAVCLEGALAHGGTVDLPGLPSP